MSTRKTSTSDKSPLTLDEWSQSILRSICNEAGANLDKASMDMAFLVIRQDLGRFAQQIQRQVRMERD